MNLETLKELDQKYAQVIANELLKRIETDECLCAKLVETPKTLKGCISYIKSEARKQAEDSCAVMLDEDVFQLAQHYFLEDSLNFETKTENNPGIAEETDDSKDEPIEDQKPKMVIETTKSKTKKEAVKQKLEEQMTLFDL